MKMKQAIIDFLYWCLKKLEGQRVERVDVKQRISLDLARVVPKNGQWYHIALTSICWVRFAPEKDEPMTIDELTVWRNSEKVEEKIEASYKFDVIAPREDKK